MMNFNHMLEFVKNKLNENDANRSKNAKHQFRSRYSHTVRVYKWAQKILIDIPSCDKDILYTAAIFHDVGYAYGKNDHAESSAKIFLEYAKDNNLDEKLTNEVARIISLHSDKRLLNDPSSTPELIILLEADLMDEEGALGLCWDLLAVGMSSPTSYYNAYNEIMKHSAHILNQDYMVTPVAKKYWDEKKRLIKDYIEALDADLFIKDGIIDEF